MPKKRTRPKNLLPFRLNVLVVLVMLLILSLLLLIGFSRLLGQPETSDTSNDLPPAAEARAQSNPLLLGAFIPNSSTDLSNINQFVDTTGQQPAIVMWFQGWEDNARFDPARMNAVAERGARPMVTWEPWDAGKEATQPEYTLRSIASGEHDAYIRQWARDAAAWDRPFYLRFAHEMNGDWYPWGVNANGNTSAQYKAAWIHVHDIFRQEGATNVRWVWAPSAEVFGNGTTLNEVYPGDNYVDWVALDGYNWGDTRSWSEWTSLAELFGPAYNALTRMTDKPVMIAETASAEAGGDKAAWIRDGLIRDIPLKLPQVEAVIWFNTDKEADWQVSSSAQALEAYREVATSRLYGGSPS